MGRVSAGDLYHVDHWVVALSQLNRSMEQRVESALLPGFQGMAFSRRVIVSVVLSGNRRPCVGKQFWAIIAVGVALGTLMVTGHSSIDSRFDSRFDSIDTRFDSVDAQFDRVDAQFGRVDARFASMEPVSTNWTLAIGSIDTRLDNIDTRIDSIDTRLDNIDRRLARVEGHLFGIEPEAEAGVLRGR